MNTNYQLFTTLKTSNKRLKKISLRVVIGIAVMVMTGKVWAQTDYTGTWYISNGNNSGYYLIPSIGGYWQDNDDTPYITTYKTGKNQNSLWRIVKVTVGGETYYRIIHNLTGKYLTFHNYVEESNHYRLRFHLESFDTPSDATLFIIQKSTSNDGIAIRPKGYDGGDNDNRYVWLDVSNNNKDNYWNLNDEGCLGVWGTLSDANNRANRYLETATPTCAVPVIAYNGGSFTIQYPIAGESVVIRYTTDGTEPTSSSPAYSGAIAASGVTMIRAIATKSGYTTSDEARLYSPVYQYVIKNIATGNESYYIVPPMDETNTTDIYATTSNVPSPKMGWLLQSAGLHNGTQYYYLVNQVTGKYMYCNVGRSSNNAIVMKSLGEEGTEASRYMFLLYEMDGYTLIVSKAFANWHPSTGSGNMLYKNNGNNHTDYIGLNSDNTNGYPRWQIIATPTDPKTLWPLGQVSNSESTTYWKIQNVSANSRYVCPPTGTDRYAKAPTTLNDEEWVIEEATDGDTWAPYYHIRNGETGQYLYFRGTGGYDNTFYVLPTDNPSNDDGFKFIIVRTANTSAPQSYNIIPKTLKDNANQTNLAMSQNNGTLKTGQSRNSNVAQWNFVAVNDFVSPPQFTQTTEDGPVSLSCFTAGATVYYTTDGSDPSTSTTRQQYSSAIALSEGVLNTIKACAVKSSITSAVVTKTVDLSTRTAGYYVLHHNGTGYIKVKGNDIDISNDDNLRYGDIFNNGHSFWVITSEGYLKNGYFYLSVANNRSLYLTTEPRTRWMMEEVDGTKKHLYINDGRQNLYLCYNSGVALSASPTKYYSACPVSISEVSWTGPTTSSLTLQSPQLVTYLRPYFEQKMNYSFVNDGGSTVSGTNQNRRIYATLEYISTSSADKGATWDISDNILYSKQTEGDVAVTATYSMLPADPIARSLHATAVEQSITFTLKPRLYTPNTKHYLLFNMANSDYRFPFDDGIPEGQAVKSYATKTQLTWPENSTISWFVETDDQGFVMFKNVNSGRYMYFDADDGMPNDYGMMKIGGTTVSDNRYKFRLYKLNQDGTWGDSIVNIIPYDRQFVVYKSDGRSNTAYAGIAATGSTYRMLSVGKPGDNKWKFYAYEIEDSYRLKSDYTISIPDAIKTSNTLATIKQEGTYNFTAQSYHWLSIKAAPQNSTTLEIYGTGSYPDITYNWAVSDLDNYVITTSATTTGANNSTYSLVVDSIPGEDDVASGKLRVTASVTSPETIQHSIEIDLHLDADAVWPKESDYINISSLSEITNSNGVYRLTSDNPTGSPAVATFSGFLDGYGHTISGLTAPLFTTIEGSAVVRNINFDEVNITNHAGPTGTVAGTATGNARVYNIGVLAGQVGSTGRCGGIVGTLDEYARVINCFSYANITGGTDVGGIVGYNNYVSKSNKLENLRTMVMNCMYYGESITGTNVSPIYGGLRIESRSDNSGLNNYNYFTQTTALNGNVVYNCALEMELRYVKHFEFYRLLLNSNRELASWYATGAVDKKHEVMAKWVIETADRTIENPKPYPVLKPQGYYPSIINIDAQNAPVTEERYIGGKMGELTVNIRMGNGAVFSAPTGATIATSQLTLPITDMDTTRYNYNYYKVQLPYYNQVGTRNYTGNRVVAGWKIVDIQGGTAGTFVAGDDATIDADGYITSTPNNFADRYCTNKDLYAVSKRVFNQGACWDVPEGVTAITIEPYWAKCTYLSDAYQDVLVSSGYGRSNFLLPGIRTSNDYLYNINGSKQKVYTNVNEAVSQLERNSEATVYDYAVVLVGNYRDVSDAIASDRLPFSFMSIDLDGDNEPDYAHICQTGNRKTISPIRIDFINSIGLGMAQKPNNSSRVPGWGIPFPNGWFEITNTTLIRFTEFEADGNTGKAESPVILQGGVYEQFVSMRTGGGAATKTSYLIVGGNAWFAMFNNGSHGSNGSGVYTKHTPVNVLGGSYDLFYLTGYFNAAVTTRSDDNAECYISGGLFGEIAGTGMEGVGGNVAWKIYGAKINNFYGGGINPVKPILGNIAVDINKSDVNIYCGGPKFGDMVSGKQVYTTAKDCTFGTYFGAGYGGTAYNVPRLYDHNPNGNFNYDYNSYIQQHYNRGYREQYSGGQQTSLIDCKGISTDYEYELFAPPAFAENNNVCRFRIRYASLSLATTHNIVSRLTRCTVMTNFYGGGNLGYVDGDVHSFLTDCKVLGNVYGAGFSAVAPTCPVMPLYPTGRYDPQPYYNTETGAYTKGVKTTQGDLYTWHHIDATITNGSTVFDETNKYIYTNVDMSNLGAITGTASLTIAGESLIGIRGEEGDAAHGNVFGGGEESSVRGDANVRIKDSARILGNVYGGGNKGNVSGNTNVTIGK